MPQAARTGSSSNQVAPKTPPKIAPGWVLSASLLGISFAGPLTRLSSADPLAIAIGRMAFSLVAIAAMLVITGEWRQFAQLEGVEW
ncbi:MAG: hypothetical protein ABI338_03645, partial [Gemmatimonadaceae bacterium]